MAACMSSGSIISPGGADGAGGRPPSRRRRHTKRLQRSDRPPVDLNDGMSCRSSAGQRRRYEVVARTALVSRNPLEGARRQAAQCRAPDGTRRSEVPSRRHRRSSASAELDHKCRRATASVASKRGGRDDVAVDSARIRGSSDRVGRLAPATVRRIGGLRSRRPGRRTVAPFRVQPAGIRRWQGRRQARLTNPFPRIISAHLGLAKRRRAPPPTPTCAARHHALTRSGRIQCIVPSALHLKVRRAANSRR
jgi:hypothetical protein